MQRLVTALRDRGDGNGDRCADRKQRATAADPDRAAAGPAQEGTGENQHRPTDLDDSDVESGQIVRFYSLPPGGV
jgi:hypothetical protein